MAEILHRFAKSRVLVVDDNLANLAVLRALLTRAGLGALETLTDPREALARFCVMEPDLVLLDLHMPQLDGFTVLERIREQAAGSYLPVLVLTADSTPAATQKALALGASDFVTKPFDHAEVVLRVRNLLETRHLYEALRRHNIKLRGQLYEYEELDRSQRQAWLLDRDQIERMVREGGVRILYQPIRDLAEGKVVGVEALARFPDESSGGPERWFAKAAAVGLGPSLERATLNAAMPALEVLPEPTFLALNLSPAALLSTPLSEIWGPEVCRRIVVELTEHVPVEDYDTIGRALVAVRARGVRLAADDTGAGYAGFRHLLGLNPDIVKLDISLTRGIHRDPLRRALATALVSFTRDIGWRLVAEGVETADELGILQELSVGWGQGYYLGPPAPLEKLLALLAVH